MCARFGADDDWHMAVLLASRSVGAMPSLRARQSRLNNRME